MCRVRVWFRVRKWKKIVTLSPKFFSGHSCSRTVSLLWCLTSNQKVLICTTHFKKVVAKLYSFILRNKISEQQYWVRNFAEVRYFAWHRDAGAWQGHYPQLYHKRRNGGRGVFYKSIIGSFMVYPDRFEINLLQLFAHPKIQNGNLKFMVLFLKPASLLTRNKHNW